ncbi:hypothetical protein [Streptomyces sp. NPDC021012]|uniref:hypothetical protein n=1 Tax=unclassified Streptomyces TaxID=2593676 RepID=UPI0037946E5B
MTVVGRAGGSSPGRPTDGALLGRSRAAACAMAGFPGSVTALQRFAHTVTRSWGLPDSACDTVALMVRELVRDLPGFGIGLDVSLMLTADDASVTLRVREAGRPRPPARAAAVPGGRGLWREEVRAVPRRPVGGARLEARVLLPEPEHAAPPTRLPEGGTERRPCRA